MRKYQSTMLMLWTLLSIATLSSSCKSDDYVISPDKSKMARAAANELNGNAELAASASYSYVVFVNGVMHRSGDNINVGANQRLFFELRAVSSDFPDKPFPAIASSWIYDNTSLSLIKRWSPELNNAYEFQVIAPIIRIPGQRRSLGNVRIGYQPLPGPLSGPMIINITQVYGGIENDPPVIQF